MKMIKSNLGFEVPASRNAGPEWSSKVSEGFVHWTHKGEDKGSVSESEYNHLRQTRKEAWGF